MLPYDNSLISRPVCMSAKLVIIKMKLIHEMRALQTEKHKHHSQPHMQHANLCDEKHPYQVDKAIAIVCADARNYDAVGQADGLRLHLQCPKNALASRPSVLKIYTRASQINSDKVTKQPNSICHTVFVAQTSTTPYPNTYMRSVRMLRPDLLVRLQNNVLQIHACRARCNFSTGGEHHHS